MKNLFALFAVVSCAAHAGTWGQENWGEMYWGSNPVSVPIAAPIVRSIVADSTDLIVTIGGYAPGQDGWSRITGYSVTCGSAGTITSDTSPVRITGLQSDTEYDCVVEAFNAQGSSPEAVKLAATDPEIQGLNIVIIRAALCASDNPATGC